MLHEKLEVYRLSVEVAADLSKESARWPKGYGYLSDQAKRAMASAVLIIAEGNARRSRAERRRFFEVSRASVIEVASCIDLALAFGLMSQERAESFKSRLGRISKMLWGLIR